MRLRATRATLFGVGVLLCVAMTASAQTTRTGTFQVSGFVGDKLAGKSVSYASESVYTADIHSDFGNAIVDHMYYYVNSPDGTWYFEIRSGAGADLAPGTFCRSTNGTNVNPPYFAIDYAPGPICSVTDGTVSVGSLIVEYGTNGGTSLVNLSATFNFLCSGSTVFNNGTLTFTNPSTGQPTNPGTLQPTTTGNCDGSSTGGGGGGTGGGFPTPGGGTGSGGGFGTGTGTLAGFPHPGGGIVPQPSTGTSTPETVPEPFISVATNRPAEEDSQPLLTTSETLTVPLVITSANLGSAVTLSAASDPEGLDFTFPTPTIKENGTYESSVTIKPSASAVPRDYRVDVTASSNGTSAVTSFLVTLDCYPPLIFGAPGNQPASQSVQTGKTTTLEVKPAGSGPFHYQWYRGSAGQTSFPIAGATNRTFVTPVSSTGSEAYWVQVANACGSVDSTTATITTTP
jgi:hypothetical protein